MKQQRTLIVLLVAVVTAAVAAYAVYLAIQNRPVREVEVASVQVVVASRTIPVGTPLNRDDLRVVAWPARYQVPGAYADPNDVIGRGVIETIGENEPITNRKIASPGAGAGLGPIIPEGMRAKSIRVNDVIGVAGYTVPGTRVDVIVAVDDDGNDRNGQQPMAKAVVKNVQVLTNNKRTDQQEATEGGTPPQTTVVTLAVTPEDAEKIALAEEEGQLSLTLRNPLDVEDAKTSGIRMIELMQGSAPAPAAPVRQPGPRRAVTQPAPVVPAPPPPLPYMVESIRGGKRTEEVVE